MNKGEGCPFPLLFKLAIRLPPKVAKLLLEESPSYSLYTFKSKRWPGTACLVITNTGISHSNAKKHKVKKINQR